MRRRTVPRLGRYAMPVSARLSETSTSERSPWRSARSVSPCPAVTSVRETTAKSRSAPMRASSVSFQIAFISRGTPGSSATRNGRSPKDRSPHRPGAVPTGLCRASKPSGTPAMRRAAGVRSRPRAAKSASRCAATPSSSTTGMPNHSATTSRVRSSVVGPSPPVATTSSTPSSTARWSAPRMPARVSRTVSHRSSSTPSAARRSPSQAAFVSTVWPMSISSPIVSRTAFMGKGDRMEG